MFMSRVSVRARDTRGVEPSVPQGSIHDHVNRERTTTVIFCVLITLYMFPTIGLIIIN